MSLTLSQLSYRGACSVGFTLAYKFFLKNTLSSFFPLSSSSPRFLPQIFIVVVVAVVNTTHTHIYQHASDISVAQRVVVAKIDIDGVDQQHH